METKVCKDCGRDLPLTNFKITRWGGRVDVCSDCATEKLRKTLNDKRKEKEQDARNKVLEALNQQKTLSMFTPRQLMEELARRGYRGKLTYVQEIDITNF